mgnify:CR=1 FL=1
MQRKKIFDSFKHWNVAILSVLMSFCMTAAFAQSGAVKGKVLDELGEPIIGANIVEKGTTNGVITDFNGQFTLNVAQGKTLVFSYVGYTTQEITVKGSSLKIIMEEDSKTLDEVVVVGYGSMSRKDVTSSIYHCESRQTECRSLF